MLPKNKKHDFATILAIGEGLRTKVNANIGTSGPCASLDDEMEKLNAAVEAGADSVMDLSTGGDLEAIRKAVLERSPIMVGAVPIYSVAATVTQSGSPIKKMDPGPSPAKHRGAVRSGPRLHHRPLRCHQGFGQAGGNL